jgi:hypothetical protein
MISKLIFSESLSAEIHNMPMRIKKITLLEKKALEEERALFLSIFLF